MSEAINAANLEQADYMKLFMQELTYQDPLKPVDNREFMAQMAQFSSLQEARSTNEHLTQLLAMHSGSQSLGLLGKKVKIQNSNEEGTVSKIEFAENTPPIIHVILSSGSVQVELGQIKEVRI